MLSGIKIAVPRIAPLHQFIGEKGHDIAVRFDTGMPSTQIINTQIKQGQQGKDANYTLLSLPLYLVERLPDLLA